MDNIYSKCICTYVYVYVNVLHVMEILFFITQYHSLLLFPKSTFHDFVFFLFMLCGCTFQSILSSSFSLYETAYSLQEGGWGNIEDNHLVIFDMKNISRGCVVRR